MRKLLGIATVLATLAAPGWARDDFQTWNNIALTYLKKDKLTLRGSAEIRLTDDSSVGRFARLTQHTRYRSSDTWSFDADLSYIRLRNAGRFDLDTLRLELAATSQWKLGSRGGFDVRNRLDLWLRSGSAKEEGVYRLRPRFTLGLGDAKRRRTLYFGNEVFFSELQERVFQNRLFPIGWNTPVGRHARLDLHLMVLSERINSEWRHRWVIGQTWSF